MKLLTTALVFLLSYASFSQWQSETKVDPFDGDQTTVIGKGSGGNFPYQTPSIIFRKRTNNLEVFVINAGSVIDNSKLLISFGDPTKVLDFELSPSTDNTAGFLIINSDDTIVKLKSLVDEFKKGTKSYLRLVTEYGNNSWQLSLSGSTKNLNSIFHPNYWSEKHPNLPDSKNIVFQNSGIKLLRNYLAKNNYKLRFPLVVENEVKSLILKHGEALKISHEYLGNEILLKIHFVKGEVEVGSFSLNF